MSNLKSFNSSLVSSILSMKLSTRLRLLLQSLLMLLTLISLYRSAHLSLLSTCLVLFLQYLLSGGYRYAYVVYRTVWRDLISLIRFKRTQFFLYALKLRNASVPKVFQKVVQRHPEKVMLHCGEEAWTFRRVDEFSNRVANYFISQGFQKGDEVALFMENRPEYVAIWLGLAKAGLVSALINTNQRLNSLVHSLTVVKTKAVIFSSEMSQPLNDVYETLNTKTENKLQYFCYDSVEREESYVYENSSSTGQAYEYKNLNNLLRDVSIRAPQERINETTLNDRLLYIYTSGTEGLPKAAIIKHSRFIYMGAGSHYMLAMTEEDILYTSLPLYHLAGGTVGVCQAAIFGNTMVIRSKFSASNFFKDCVKYRCTVAQYIGEICRYLLAQPESPYDKTHSLRLLFGNGLRPNIWREFVTRFNIPQIGELYGSTEGNASMINVDNTEGACGFISQIGSFLYPANLIKVDEKTGEPIRDRNGLCIKVSANETGEFVGKIIENDPSRAFDGYASKDATEKKIIHNVFSKGDAAFASGDLLTMDRFGYLYFKDRCGDTYRWKGENVSTMEVEAIISNILNLSDAIVFGVPVPGCEGKAGMAAILDPEQRVDLEQLLEKLRANMPLFSVPVFIRLAKHFEMTATHKLPKVTLKRDGYDPAATADPLYMLDAKQGKYVRIDQALYEDIQKGVVKF